MKRRITFGIAILVLITQQACFVARDYTRPEMFDEIGFRTDTATMDTLTMATIAWRDFFSDPILQSYIEEGLQNNLDIRTALTRIDAAQAWMRQGKAGYLPSISADASASHFEFSDNGQARGAGSINVFELGAGLSWEADIWGKIRSTRRAYQARYLQSQAAHQAVKTRLIAGIATFYYDLLAIDAQMDITQATIENRKRSLTTAIALKNAGNETEAGVKQTEAQLYTAQAIFIDLQKQARIYESALSLLLGSQPRPLARNTFDDQIVDTVLLTGIPLQLLGNRPDILAAEYNLINAFELTNVARSNFYPSLTLSASAGLQSLELQNLFSLNSLFANVVGGLAQPILNGRRIRTQYEVAQAEQEQARLQYLQTFLTATAEVSDALYSFDATTRKIEVKQKEYEAYNDAVRYSEALVNNGLANYLQVLIARERSLASSLTLAENKATRLKYLVQLYEALGGGWK
ncbi:MAG: efflux transporter outer membrane subunit [Bacteroidales bacterium]|jgi:NodT family efflux transporter outer membrane factor (OMF) lipoprotein|nr:efflux transporter outer membrane subunit [Bacteroidales bacterium]MDD3131528.1 efflux transporter outer membrane subunit [Bacteroidales bacterium]MDY0334387.1 efflux transporter outer membrane subunit [Bacteroidales bacterium]NCU35366.1 efflux transporter outer membrane subunit [Candidatus Falkowbacteria bacterium]